MTVMEEAVIDPTRCPLCQKPNACAMAEEGGDAASCWCRAARVAPEALARVPAEQQGRVCLCAGCVAYPVARIRTP